MVLPVVRGRALIDALTHFEWVRAKKPSVEGS
jgi:hypothetical protein